MNRVAVPVLEEEEEEEDQDEGPLDQPPIYPDENEVPGPTPLKDPPYGGGEEE